MSDAQNEQRLIRKAFEAGLITDEDVHTLLMSSRRIQAQSYFAPELLKDFKKNAGRAMPGLAKKMIDRLEFLPEVAQANITKSLISLVTEKVQAQQLDAAKQAKKTVAPKPSVPKNDMAM